MKTTQNDSLDSVCCDGNRSMVRSYLPAAGRQDSLRDLTASTIVDIYKARWQIELFCKWIKQNLKVKSCIGTSKNAVMTQTGIAMCVFTAQLHRAQPSANTQTLTT